MGHVTEAQAKTKGNPESRLRIVFDKVIAKGGQEVAFNGVIRAMSAPVEVPATSLGGGNVERTANNGGRGVGPVPMGGATNASPGGGATTRDVGNTAGSIADSAGGAVNNTAGGAMGGATGGVVGMDGISLNANAPGGAGSLISSTSRNVKLDSGTQMLLQVTGSAAAH